MVGDPVTPSAPRTVNTLHSIYLPSDPAQTPETPTKVCRRDDDDDNGSPPPKKQKLETSMDQKLADSIDATRQ